MHIGPGHHGAAAFNGLAQAFQHLAAAFGQFVQKQHAAVARLTSPGRALVPPPIIAAMDEE